MFANLGKQSVRYKVHLSNTSTTTDTYLTLLPGARLLLEDLRLLVFLNLLGDLFT